MRRYNFSAIEPFIAIRQRKKDLYISLLLFSLFLISRTPTLPNLRGRKNAFPSRRPSATFSLPLTQACYRITGHSSILHEHIQSIYHLPTSLRSTLRKITPESAADVSPAKKKTPSIKPSYRLYLYKLFILGPFRSCRLHAKNNTG